MDKHQQLALSRALRRKETDAERLLWSHLRSNQLRGVKFRRQQTVGSYIVDFVSFDKMLIIEVDGGQHNELDTRVKDEYRMEYLRDKGYRILRFWNNDILQNIEGVLTSIAEDVDKHPRGI